MSFERNQLPDAVSYYEGEGLRLIGPQSAKWKTTECRFHGGSESRGPPCGAACRAQRHSVASSTTASMPHRASVLWILISFELISSSQLPAKVAIFR